MLDHTLSFLRFVFQTGDVVELRGLGENRRSGRFDDFARMARSAHGLQNGNYVTGVYYTINTLKPTANHVGHRERNKVARIAKKTSSRSDMQGRALYAIDVDPVRPSGVASTEEEKASAWKVAEAVKMWLLERGWPEPVVVDSGNGYHLLYRGDRCDPDSKAWKWLLGVIADAHDTPEAHVDRAVFDPSRILRLPGTLNRKGLDTPERPHRVCQVVSYPERWTPVAHGPNVYRLAAQHGFEKVVPRVSDPDRPTLVDDPGEAIAEFIADYPDELEVRKVMERNGAMFWVLRECPFVGRSHSGDPNKTAIMLTSDHVLFKCLADGCAHRTMKDLRALLAEKTGRGSNARFYKQSESRRNSAENRELERLMDRAAAKALMDPEYLYEQETFDVIVHCKPTTTDPDVYGLTPHQVYNGFVVLSIILGEERDDNDLAIKMLSSARTKPIQEMADVLGPANLYALYRHVNSPSPNVVERTMKKGEKLTELTMLALMREHSGPYSLLPGSTPECYGRYPWYSYISFLRDPEGEPLS